MVSGNTKRIVVIKDIPSNMIEEAILILKSDAGPHEGKEQKIVSAKNSGRSNDFLLREAEMVINNYMRESKTTAAARRNPDLVKKFPGARFMTNTVINAALIVCAALLLFIISKLF